METGRDPVLLPVGDVLVLPLLARERVSLPADAEPGAASGLVRHPTPGPLHPAARSRPPLVGSLIANLKGRQREAVYGGLRRPENQSRNPPTFLWFESKQKAHYFS